MFVLYGTHSEAMAVLGSGCQLICLKRAAGRQDSYALCAPVMRKLTAGDSSSVSISGNISLCVPARGQVSVIDEWTRLCHIREVELFMQIRAFTVVNCFVFPLVSHCFCTDR